ncbi:MAG: alpha-2-macroglobulin, partial [Spirochaetes bacterium]|nr:alpha-2-macroglobulin [Spirochaetota bacterium]
VEVPVKKEYLPNVYVCVTLLKGRVEDPSYTNHGMDLGKPSLKIGYAEISVTPEERHLKVDVSKSHETRSPGEPLEVAFQVKDKKGQGQISECMVAVCDVGVLNLIGFNTPDFFNDFYAQRPLGVMTSDTRLHIIGQRNYGEKGENSGGGGPGEMGKKRNGGMDMDMFSFRKNFLSTAFFESSIVTGEDGKGKVKFNLPDNLTTFRIMVTALTKESLFGAGDSTVVVKKYLMLKSTMPSFAIVGDKFSAGAVIYNYTEEDTKISIKIETAGAGIDEPDTKEVFVKKGESADVRFKINCNTVGMVKVKIAARAGKHTDAIEKEFSVKAPRLVESVALFESMDSDSALQKVIIPKKEEVFSGAGFLNISLAPSAFSGLKSGIDYLFEYPYGCLEQKISKAIPVVLSKRLILDMNLTEYKEGELDRLVKDVIKELPSFQSYNGGFCYWTSKYWDSPWLTAYAAYFLIKAQKEGYKIDEKILSRALNYLKDYGRRNSIRKDLPYSTYCHLSTKAYIAYVLALGGMGDRTIINDLYKNIDKIPLFGKASLLKALYHTGYSKKYLEKVRQVLFNKVKISSTTAHYEDEGMEDLYWIHSSSVRATSAVLQAFMESKTENPLNEKVANWLKKKMKAGSRFRNTQENVWAYHAMTDYFKFYEKEKPDFKTTVSVDGKNILSHLFNKRTQPVYSKQFGFSQFKRGEELSLNISRKGKGRLYYSLRMNYAPRELLKSRDEGIKVTKWYETLDGKKVEEPVFNTGKDYVVVLKVNTKAERHFVVLDDPIPAGFKILNLSF